MKNIKNTVATIALMAVLGLGSTVANAGIIISDAPVPETKSQCTTVKGGFLQTMAGVLIQGISGVLIQGVNGMLISDGLIMSDASTKGCSTSKDGFLLSDGMLISD